MRANRLIGRQVAGRFKIERFLGEGGMATVFVAHQEAEPREVALKIMNEDLTADRSFVKRFQREAKAAARVQHPNSVAIIDYGVADGLSYIAMELLAGDDLYVLLERDGAITQARAARIVIEVCDALMVAHELGIVHRDLKPENIMVIPDATVPSGERVKVLDFGIAKLLAPDTVAPDPRLDPTSAVTRAGTFIGTPAYMSPEQCALLPVDTRADIYTCGVLLFQLVTGRLPFEGQTPLHTATLHIHEPAPRPSSFAPSIDPRLEAVIMKALAKKPTERHQTARHLASTLRKILPDMPDTRVAKVGRPAASAMRPRGSTRNSAVEAPASRPPLSSDPAMESAKTMVQTAGAASPPSVVLRSDVSAPASDPAADSSPARIRPAAGGPPRPAAGAPPPPPDDDDSLDSDDSMRTLVRPPADEEPPPHRFGPQHTEVIVPSIEALAQAAALGPPPAPPPPVKADEPTKPGLKLGEPAKPLKLPRPPAPPAVDPRAEASGRSDEEVTSPAPRPPPPAAPRPPLPRGIKPTLKSAGEFKPVSGETPPDAAKPGSSAVVRIPAPPPVTPEEIDSEDSSLTPVTSLVGGLVGGLAGGVGAGGPVVSGGLGSLQLGAGQLSSTNAGADDRAEDRDRTSSVPPTEADPPGSVQIVLNAAAFAETAKVEVADPSQLGAVFGTAATVPLISPATVAAAMAKGARQGQAALPRPGATTMPVLIAPVSPAAPRSAETAPTLHEASAPPAPEAPLPPPPTPPIYPLAPAPEAASAISGTRGLLIGFLAGALLMGLVAVVYFVIGR